MNFSENLRKIRVEHNLSQQELAKKLNVAQSTVSMWEGGKRTPKLDEIDRLAGVLKVTVVRFLSQEKEDRVEITTNEIFVDGNKISDLDNADIHNIVEYINSLKHKKRKSPQKTPPDKVSAAKKILIIDDEQEMCEMLYAFLIPHNYKVFLAFNGQMGLEYFETIKPDLVLLDLKMPDIDGVEVLKIIRKISNTPIIIITGHPQDVSEIHLTGLKIEGYIEKPIRLKDVLNTLKHLIGE